MPSYIEDTDFGSGFIKESDISGDVFSYKDADQCVEEISDRSGPSSLNVKDRRGPKTLLCI
ncbi:hypothetical protein DPMN_066147 [Dreissena polymorpha]|uniref:Uncharacterized protein n=1 Tax=Dreissena polymorpha TaxID=45954 RepID=A0A9D4BUS3_DREPO|nr:hypothetical protein DPMN_066147 [Dreissena polymorpha]